MNIYLPVTRENGTRDSRYAVAFETIDNGDRRWTLRYRGEIVMQSFSRNACMVRAVGMAAAHRGALVVEGIPA